MISWEFALMNTAGRLPTAKAFVKWTHYLFSFKRSLFFLPPDVVKSR